MSTIRFFNSLMAPAATSDCSRNERAGLCPPGALAKPRGGWFGYRSLLQPKEGEAP